MKKNLLLYAIGGFAIYWLWKNRSKTSVAPQTEVPLDESSSAPTPPTRGGVMEAQVIDLPSGGGYNQGINIIQPRPPKDTINNVKQYPKKLKPRVFGLQVPRFENGSLALPKLLANRKPKIVYYGELERITPYEDTSRIVKYKHRTMGDIVISEIDENQNMVWYYEANRYPIKIIYPTR
jgi:hypothetical protein